MALAMNGGSMPEYVAVWTLLDTATLWRTDELPPPREPSGITDNGHAILSLLRGLRLRPGRSSHLGRH